MAEDKKTTPEADKNGIPTPEDVYDSQADLYVPFSETSFSWLYIEKPALDRYISEFYNPTTRILDVGCGSGRLIAHLIFKGIRPGNVVGIDVSTKMLEYARQELPNEVKLKKASLSDFDLEPEIFDLVTSSMVLHHLDNEELDAALKRIHRVLKPNGVFFFIDTDPERIAGSTDPKNEDKWLFPPTPWGTTQPFFNRTTHKLEQILQAKGFDKLDGGPIKASDEGKIDAEQYVDYTERPARIAVKLRKMPIEVS